MVFYEKMTRVAIINREDIPRLLLLMDKKVRPPEDCWLRVSHETNPKDDLGSETTRFHKVIGAWREEYFFILTLEGQAEDGTVVFGLLVYNPDNAPTSLKLSPVPFSKLGLPELSEDLRIGISAMLKFNPPANKGGGTVENFRLALNKGWSAADTLRVLNEMVKLRVCGFSAGRGWFCIMSRAHTEECFGKLP